MIISVMSKRNAAAAPPSVAPPIPQLPAGKGGAEEVAVPADAGRACTGRSVRTAYAKLP
jgi:hypothetical protein